MAPDTVKNLVMSFIRTWAPIIAGGLLSWLAVHASFIADESTKAGLIVLLTGIMQGLYYFVVRIVETYVSPKFSFLLADVRKGDVAPVYPDATETTVVPPAVEAP